MPLCKTKMDETTVEDLAELSEIENNLGQVCAHLVIYSGNIFLSTCIFHCYEPCEAPSYMRDYWRIFLTPCIGCRFVVHVPSQT